MTIEWYQMKYEQYQIAQFQRLIRKDTWQATYDKACEQADNFLNEHKEGLSMLQLEKIDQETGNIYLSMVRYFIMKPNHIKGYDDYWKSRNEEQQAKYSQMDYIHK